MWIFLGVVAVIVGWLVLTALFGAPRQQSDTLPRAAPQEPLAKTRAPSLPAETQPLIPPAPPEPPKSIEPVVPEEPAACQPSPPAGPGLKIELIPRQMAGMNARAVLTREAWDEVRHIVHTQHGWSCVECHSEKRLECHEVWKYEWARRHARNVPVMRLVGLQTLCRRCHQGKHIKFVESHEPHELPVVRAHLMSVHGLTEAQLDQHVRRAVTRVNGLTYAYRLDLTYLNDRRFAAVQRLMARTFGENENRYCRKGTQGEPQPAS